jgi:outer membrane scaffolding protein for murein synthesis (MipA/OmpV family)
MRLIVKKLRARSRLLALLPTLLCAPARADGWADPAPVSGWIVTVRANAGFSPNYDGSKDLSPYILPGLSMRRPNTPVAFSSPDQSPGFTLYDNGVFKAGLAGRIGGPRSTTDYAELKGVHDIDWTVEAGGFAEFWTFKKLRARAELRQGLCGHHGVVADFYLDWVENHGPWTFAIGPRFTLASQSYMNKFFGVTPYEALMNGHLYAFNPSSGGAKSIGVTSSLSYQWSEAWTTTLYAKYAHLLGHAADGPITQRLGSPHQFTIGMSVAYSFHWDAFGM